MPVRKAAKNSWSAEKKIYRTFPTKGEAMRYERAVLTAVARIDSEGTEPDDCCSIRDRLDRFLEDRTEGRGCRPCNAQTAELYRRRLLRFDQVFHSRPLSTVTTEEIERWRTRRRRAKQNGRRLQRETVNAELGALKTFARWAQSRGWAPADLPLMTVPRLFEPGKIAKRNRKPPRVIGIHDLLQLIEQIGRQRPDIGLFFQGMLLFILRPAQVCRLRRRDVSMPRGRLAGQIYIAPVKGMHARTLSVAPDSWAARWLRECLAMGGSVARPNDPLVLCLGGRSRINPGGWTTATLDRAVHRVCRQLEVSVPFTPYWIRHSIVTWAYQNQTINLAGLTAAGGWAKATTIDFYAHAAAADGLPVFEAIDGVYGDFKQGTGG